MGGKVNLFNMQESICTRRDCSVQGSVDERNGSFAAGSKWLNGVGAAGCSDFGEFCGATAERNFRGRYTCQELDECWRC
jgi:hypothetical protein